MLPNASTRAQQNPEESNCGLPASGSINQSVTYTLSRDCHLTDTLYVHHTASLTINGNGRRITANPLAPQGMIQALSNSGVTPTVTLIQVTLDWEGKDHNHTLVIDKLIANQVTFQNSIDEIGILTQSYENWSLTNVLFRNIVGKAQVNPSVLHVKDGATLTLDNVAFENNLLGVGAVLIEDSPTLTVSGCLSDVANIPRLVSGSLPDTSTGPCTGRVGNGHTLRVRSAAPASCGFPSSGEVRVDAEYTLSGYCRLTGNLYIRDGVTVTVNGNDNTIGGNGSSNIWIASGGRLNLNDVALDVLRFFNYGRLDLARAAFYGQRSRAIFNAGVVNANKLLLKDLNLAPAPSQALLTYSYIQASSMTIRDGIFDNIRNQSGRATIWAFATAGNSATVTLEGCVSFINNSPENAYTSAAGGATITDNTGGTACPDSLLAEFPKRYVPPTPPPTPRPRDPEPAAKAPLCPSLPAGHGRFGLIGSAEWRGHFARLGIQAQDAAQQAKWSNGDHSVAGINVCFWDYECSTDAHWAYGSYHAAHGHITHAPGSRPPLAADRSADGKFNLCYSVWKNGCNSAEAWQFGWESGKQIYDRYFRRAVERSGCVPRS